MLDGLFDRLATKLKPQYNEAIKSLQFRKLYGLDNEKMLKNGWEGCVWQQWSAITEKWIDN